MLSYIPNRAVVSKLFSEIAPRFSNRNGGYLRLVQTRNRVNDGAPMAVLEFIDYESIKKPKKRKRRQRQRRKQKRRRKRKSNFTL